MNRPPHGTRAFSRRRFLKAALASAVAPLVLPSRILHAASGTPNSRVNLALLGLGGRGTHALKSSLGLDDVRVAAICDCNKAKLQRGEEIVRRMDKDSGDALGVYQDFREMLSRSDIDGVVISTTDHWHVPLAIYAVQAGKDVYVEKPLGVAVSWNRRLREVVEQYGAIFQYGTQQRSGPSFQYACELVRNGYIGSIKRIEAWSKGQADLSGYSRMGSPDRTQIIPVPVELDYDMWLGPAPVSPYTKDRTTPSGSYFVYDNSLGFIAGWGAHPLDIVQWGLGNDDKVPVEYEGTGFIPSEGLYDTVAAWDVRCRYADGVEMRFMNEGTARPVIAKYRRHWDHGTTFFGDEGWVSVGRDDVFTSDPKLQKITFRSGDMRLSQGGGKEKTANADNHLANFVACMKTRQQPLSPIRAAVNSDLISHLSDICIRQGRRIEWDPATENIPNDPEAARMLSRPLREPWTV